MQWAIFAVRNATEGHQVNQDVLAGLAKHGQLEDSQLLQELGLVQGLDGKVVKRT